MRRLCPEAGLLLLAGLLAATLIVGCGGGSSGPPATSTPSRAQSLGIEIAQAYGELLERARVLVEPRPLAPVAKEELRLLREEYKVRFGNYACLRDTLDDAEQAEIAASFDANRNAFLPHDMTWLEAAASDYDYEDTEIRPRLEEIRTLDDYAFLERVAESRPGEVLLCGG